VVDGGSYVERQVHHGHRRAEGRAWRTGGDLRERPACLGVLYLLSGPGGIEDQAIRDATGRQRFDGLKEVVPFARLSITL